MIDLAAEWFIFNICLDDELMLEFREEIFPS